MSTYVYIYNCRISYNSHHFDLFHITLHTKTTDLKTYNATTIHHNFLYNKVHHKVFVCNHIELDHHQLLQYIHLYSDKRFRLNHILFCNFTMLNIKWIYQYKYSNKTHFVHKQMLIFHLVVHHANNKLIDYYDLNLSI
jgi:hypothetical protein